MTDTHCKGMALSTARIHQKRSVASRFTWTMDYHV